VHLREQVETHEAPVPVVRRAASVSSTAAR
jgi:hypothetical protein